MFEKHENQMMTASKVAAILRLHVKTVQRYSREGRIRALRIGKQYRYRREWVDDFVSRAGGERHDR